MQLIVIAEYVEYLVKPLDSMIEPREQSRAYALHASLKEIFAGDFHANRVMWLASAPTSALPRRFAGGGTHRHAQLVALLTAAGAPTSIRRLNATARG